MFGWDWAVIGKLAVELLDSELVKSAEDKVATEANRKIQDLWRRVQWSQAEESYRARLLPFVSTTRLLGNPKEVSIDQLYTDVLVYGRMSALRRTSALIDPKADGSSVDEVGMDRRSARSIVETRANLYLLGHPGAGKTTFLRYLAILGCKGILSQVPIYIQLRDVARSFRPISEGGESSRQYLSRLLLSAVEEEFKVCRLPDVSKFLELLFENGRALVLIDGLDEVPSHAGMREAIIDCIRAFQRGFPSVQMCVTCRVAASEYTFEHFEYAELAPFSDEQQITFIRKWFVEDQPSRDKILSAWTLSRSRTLRDLGKTPLLLALICLAFDDLGDLPDRRVDLYREALEALFKRWDSSRAISRDPFYANLTPYRREQLVQELAAALFERDAITFSERDVQPIIEKWFEKLPEFQLPEGIKVDGAEVLSQLEAQHGIIIQRARGTYSFAHLSIQEYLCARSICEGHPQRTLEELAKRRLLDAHWREVIVFCAGLLQDGTQFLHMLIQSANKLLTEFDNLRSLLTQIQSSFVAGKTTPSADDFLFEHSNQAGIASLRLTIELARRLNGFGWTSEKDGLRIRVALLREHLLHCHVDPNQPYHDQLQEGSPLFRYLQAVTLIVDCAAVATCATRGRMISQLVSNIRS